MSREDTKSSNNGAAPSEAPPPATAKDVALAISKIVEVIGHLPPPLQLRALGGAATALGVDSSSRNRSSATQQRSTNTNTNNNSQQRGGGQR